MNENKLIQVSIPCTGEEEASAVRNVILSGKFISGQNVKLLEEKFASYIGVSRASAVNSGTAALHIALALLGIGPGDEVIVPSLTFMSTVTAVLHQNATPVFADIDEHSYCISPKDIKQRINSKTKAIIPVHLYGNAAAMDEITEIAKMHNLYVIEDCAQAHGTEYNGKRVGSMGHMGIFSFFATKHMTTGEGGMITADRTDWILKANQIRNHGMSNRDEHIFLGYNYRMNEMAAAMGIVQLKKLEKLNNKRIANSLYILNKLSEQYKPWYRLPKLDPLVKHTFFWCPIIIDPEMGYTVQDVLARLKIKGIEVRHRYYVPLYKQPIFQNMDAYTNDCASAGMIPKYQQNYRNLYLPNVEAVAGKIIGLPNHPLLTQDDLDYIVAVVKNLFN